MKVRNLVLGLILGANVLTVQSAVVSTAGTTAAAIVTANAAAMSASTTIASTVTNNMMNSNNSVVVECRLVTDGIFGGKPSMKETIKDTRCQWNKKTMEELNNTRYEFGKVKGIFDVRGATHVMIELIEVK